MTGVQTCALPICIAVARDADIEWVKKLLAWINSIQHADEQLIKQELKLWVEEYTADIRINQEIQLGLAQTTIH